MSVRLSKMSLLLLPSRSFLVLLIVQIFFIGCISALHESFNTVVPAKQRECFFEDVAPADVSQAYNIEIFLESGGNLDITFTIHGPLSTAEIIQQSFENPIFSQFIDVNMESEYDTQTYQTDFKAPVEGSYAFCLDNRNARFLPKYIEIDIHQHTNNDYKHQRMLELSQISGKTSSEPEIDVKKVEGALNLLANIQAGISKIQLQQMRDKHRLSLHSDENEVNYNGVLFSSVIETFFFIAVSAFQIYFVRRWFVTKSDKSKSKSRA